MSSRTGGTSTPDPRALVLHSLVADPARADEQDTLVQVAQLEEALRALGYLVRRLPLGRDFTDALRDIAAWQPDVAFNLVESLDGESRRAWIAAALLENLGIEPCGCAAQALLVTGDKRLCKRVLRGAGIATPSELGADDAVLWSRGTRAIIKSVHEDASLGIDAGSVVSGRRAARRALAQRSARFGGAWFAERFIDGREFNIALLGPAGAPQVLPIAEIHFLDYPRGVPRIVDYAAKWDPASHAYHHTPPVYDFPAGDAGLIAHLADLGRYCWEVLELRGYARVDVRVDECGKPWVLEVNANPCIAPDAGFVAAAKRAGLDYPALVDRIIDARDAGRAAPAVRSAA